jgi:MYXO-CTERM domain-containing protein
MTRLVYGTACARTARARTARAATLALAAATILFPARARASATFTIQNTDVAGQGFNDPTPVAPVGGNTGTTLGQQRLNAFKQATSLWGMMLDSNVPIVIDASFAPLACDSTGITLGQASPANWEIPTSGPAAGMLVPEALADRLAGQDLHPGQPDIQAQFNGALLQCSGGMQDWYYGFDGKASANDIDLVSTLLHEFGHGLGFSSTVDNQTGELLGGPVDVFTAHLYDNQTNALWSNMTNAQRAASVQNVRHLVWQGSNVAATAPVVLAKGFPRITATPTLSGLLGALSEATFGTYLSAGSVHGAVVTGSAAGVCANATTPNYSGKIVLYQGGICAPIGLANIAESTGAVAVLISDENAVSPPSSIEAAPTTVSQFPVSIPTIGVSVQDASLLASGETVTLDAVGTELVGADTQGRMYMYASDPIVQGSTVSHWDPIARPNLMEEPNASFIISHDIRMEAAVMRDIGWAPFCGDSQLEQQEQCDNGAANSDTAPDACRTNCMNAHCGDGVVDTGEACDNGSNNSDTVSGACRTKCVKASCGDGVVDPGEQCDNGPQNATGAACNTQCQGTSPTGSGGSNGTGGKNGSGGTSGTGSGGSSGNGGSNGTGNGGSNGTGNGGSSGGGDGGGGGCKCAVGETSHPGAALVLFTGLGLVAGRRRRTRKA